jgi:hypothetical protein
MVYKPTEYSKTKAKSMGLEIQSSKTKGKKLDVFRNDKKIASIGAKNYGDYPNYLKTKGKAFADERRRLYRKRTDWCKDKLNCKLSRDILW